MSNTNTNPDSSNESHLDEIEEKEDQREEAQLDDSLGDNGLLPVPEATPADGEAPAA